MSFTENKREQIKRYILEKIDNNSDDVVKKTRESFEISLNTVYRYLRELKNDGIIKKNGKRYELSTKVDGVILYRDKHDMDEEDVVYRTYVQKHINDMPINVRKIWEYSFMEMMNNVIDHSESPIAVIYINKSYINTTIAIMDEGIGIFRKIKEYYNYDSLDDVIGELFKGKLTTDSKNHSGEGIFFTSRMLDEFAALSDGKIFTHDKYYEILENLENIPNLEAWKDSKGTIILMRLSNFSNKTTTEVFDMFADEDGGFNRTHIPIKSVFETYPVSRSQAKRLCNRFEKFEEIELDFREVDEIGQAFAHEIFVKFQNNHPGIKLIPLNMDSKVEKMINHVKNTSI